MSQPLQTYASVRATLALVSYRDWSFELIEVGLDSGFLLQVQFDALDFASQSEQRQRGRKWYLSPYCTHSEIVQTAFLAVKTAEEHEAREAFRYRGRPIFGPHFRCDDLARLCEAGSFDARQPLSQEPAP